MIIVHRRALITSLALFLVSCFLFLVSAYVRAQSAPPDPLTDGVSVHLIPSKPIVLPGEPVDVDVYVIPNGHQVTAAELRLTFDPQFFAPRSPHPIATSSALSLILPNSDAGPGTPFPATSSATQNQALIYLAVNCTPDGCPFPNPSTRFKLATLQLQTIAQTPGISTVNPRGENQTTLTAALAFDNDATKVTTATSLTVAQCPLTYDYQPNGTIDVTDLMLAASKWNTGPGNNAYNGQFDHDRDGDVDIVDIQSAASTWNQRCGQ